MSDGIMALFGAPLAHEDHAVRACYAALRMQDAVRRYSDELRRAQGVEVQIRVGLNSGEVVVRSIGSDLRMDYTAVGQTTHPAAHMEQLAAPAAAHRRDAAPGRGLRPGHPAWPGADHAWLILQSASVSYGKARPYLPVIELLRGYFEIESPDDPRRRPLLPSCVVESVGVEVRTKVLVGDETSGLAKDGATGSRVQFRMSGNGESLKSPIRQHAPQLDVATALGVHRESELTRMRTTSAPARRRSLGMRQL
jgi:hypothetical protein